MLIFVEGVEDNDEINFEVFEDKELEELEEIKDVVKRVYIDNFGEEEISLLFVVKKKKIIFGGIFMRCKSKKLKGEDISFFDEV